jgi:tetratricopeptide (TPR) repeat protein
MTAVLGAVDTATTGFLSGAAGEMGRRSSEALADLVRRMRRRGAVAEGEESTSAGEGTDTPCVAPTTADERRELAHRLTQHAHQEPDFARDLEAWLREADRLTPSAVHVTAPDVPRPQMLPPGTAVFTNRERIRDEVAAMVDGPREFGVDAPRIVVFVGPGGIGKTAMAIHCARGLASRFPDGSLYVDLRGESSSAALAPSDALVRFLHMLDVPPDKVPADEERQTDLYRDCTADRRLVVVLDNAHSVGQIRPLLTAAPGSLVIVTSRYRLPELARDYGARVIKLGPLSVADSVQLLTRIVGTERVARQRAGAMAVAQRCGGSPLALCETGARVAVREHLSWETVERQFADRSRRVEGNTGMDDPSGTDAVLYATDLSYRDLSPGAARMYRLLGVWPWPSITVGAAAAAVDAAEDEARAVLEELAGIHLLEEVGEERYRFQDAVRRHAEERAQAEEGRPAVSDAVRRMMTWYLRFAASADFRVIPSRWRLGPAYHSLTLPRERDPADARVALAQLRDERENLAEAVRAAEEYRFDELAWQLCEAMWGLHLRLGFHEQWVAAHLRGVAAARRCAASFGDPRAEGRMLTQLAFAQMGRGQLAEAEQELVEALAVDQRAGHRRGQATAAEALGLVRLQQWRYADAEASFRDAQRILRGIGPGEDGEKDVPRGLAILEHHIGRALRGQGRLPESMSRLNSALALFQQLPERDVYNEARVRMSLGETHLAAGHAAAGGACLDEAFAAMEKEGAVRQQADAAELRALCARALGDPADEVRRLRVARSLYEKSGDWSAVGRVTAKLAELGEE